MRRHLLLLSITLPIICSAQSWCPPGATWTYDYTLISGGPGPTADHILKVEYIGDTILDGQMVQQLEQTGYTYIFEDLVQVISWAALYTYVADDVVYLRRQLTNGFDTLYNFNALPGDQWSVPEMVPNFIVLDTLSTVINDVLLRQLVVDATSIGLSEPDTITERIGFHYLFMRPAGSSTTILNGIVHGLRCYRDDQILFSRIGDGSCDVTLSIPQEDRVPFLLHPNPGADHFVLQLPDGPYDLQLLDQLGRSVMQIDRISDQAMISTASLPCGMYTVLITDRNGHSFHQRWIKE